MITVPVVLNYDQTKKVGTVTLDETQVPPGIDWILAMGYRVIETVNDKPTKIRIVEFGMIDVHQHAALEASIDKPSYATRWEAVARNIAAGIPDGVATFERVAKAHGLDPVRQADGVARIVG